MEGQAVAAAGGTLRISAKAIPLSPRLEKTLLTLRTFMDSVAPKPVTIRMAKNQGIDRQELYQLQEYGYALVTHRAGAGHSFVSLLAPGRAYQQT